MKERSYIGSIGILLYVVLSLIDRFIFEIPNCIYIPVAILGILIVVVGILIDRKRS